MLQAAVVIPIVRYVEPAIVFIKRAAHMRRNPGQIAFPGGIVEAADADPTATALREFEEELGISAQRVRIVDRLDPVVTLSLGVSVTPLVGVLEPPLEYRLDESEIAGVQEVPIAALYAPGAVREGTETIPRDGREVVVSTWIFDHEGLHVWGATARMLHGLLARYPSVVDLPA
jgi:8-oxo-dGTP pyrophosphatase MutT (NUDIX family)